MLGDGVPASEGCDEAAGGVVRCHSEGAIPFLPIICIPIQGELVHDVRTHEVGKFF